MTNNLGDLLKIIHIIPIEPAPAGDREVLTEGQLCPPPLELLQLHHMLLISRFKVFSHETSLSRYLRNVG